MHILITSAAAPLARSLAAALSDNHRIRLTEQVFVQSDHEFVRCELDHDASTHLLVRCVDALVHVAAPRPETTTDEQIDYATRCTYNLLTAAAAEGVSKVVFLSSLELMAAYDEHYLVDEHWRPLPQPEPPTLTQYLGELVCREFAREHLLNVAVLRLGQMDGRDVAQAISAVLAGDMSNWAIYHIAPDSLQMRFSTVKAQQELGFQPRFSDASA